MSSKNRIRNSEQLIEGLFREPSYARSTKASESSDQDFKEQEKIKQAFQMSSFVTLQQLESQKDSLRDSLYEALDVGSRRDSVQSYQSSVTDKGFGEYNYMHSEYGREKEIEKKEKKKAKEKEMKIGKGQSFKTANPQMSKYHIYPHKIDPFEALEDTEFRIRMISRAKRLAGDFMPSGAKLDAPSRALFRELLEDLHQLLISDWKELNPMVYIEDDLILIFYDMNDEEKKQDLNALVSYMNFLAHSNEIVAKYRLVRITDRWNVQVGEKRLFVFRPPWVARRSYDPISTVKKKTKKSKHPHS